MDERTLYLKIKSIMNEHDRRVDEYDGDIDWDYEEFCKTCIDSIQTEIWNYEQTQGITHETT